MVSPLLFGERARTKMQTKNRSSLNGDQCFATYSTTKLRRGGEAISAISPSLRSRNEKIKQGTVYPRSGTFRRTSKGDVATSESRLGYYNSFSLSSGVAVSLLLKPRLKQTHNKFLATYIEQNTVYKTKQWPYLPLTTTLFFQQSSSHK